MSKYTPEQLVERARQCFKLASEAEDEQRQRERDDLLFQFSENQWSDAAKAERGPYDSNGQPQPPRPMLSIDRISQPMQLVFNQWARARLGVNVHPVNETTPQETAEIVQGLYRRIERDGKANQARGWGLKRTLAGGRGWYRIVTRYDEQADMDGPGAWDQEIAYERILYQENVYPDPSATKPDYSDGEWLLYVAWKTLEDFRREFPEAKLSQGEGRFEWEGLRASDPDWVRQDGDSDTRAVLVAEYWYKDIQREEIKHPKGGPSRYRDNTTVYCAKLYGQELLGEVEEWNGHYIPFIPVIGNEMIPVDGKRRTEGMIRKARPGQEFYNYSASTLVERMSLEPKAPFMVDPRQIDGYQDAWAVANRRSLPYLPYNAVSENGTLLPPPARAQLDQSGMSIALMALREADTFIQSVTAVYSPALGQMPESRDAQSGRAILALQQQTDAGTSQFIQNMADVTMMYEAQVILDLIPAIYDRPGRIAQVLGLEDEPDSVMLNAPFVRDDSGNPVPPQPGQEAEATTYDLRNARYTISVDIGKSFQTRLQEGGEMIGEILAKAPGLMELIGPTYFRFQDFPGAKEVAEILQKFRDMKYPALANDDQNSPEALKAKAQALEMQSQELQQQLQQAIQAIQTKQVEQQAKIQVEQIKTQADMAMEQMKLEAEKAMNQADNAAKILVARISAAQAALDTEASVKEELLSTGLKVQAQAAETAVQHEHEERMAERDHEHQADMTALGATETENTEPKGGN